MVQRRHQKAVADVGDGQMGAWKTSEPAELIQDGYLFGALELPKTFLRAV
jgi:hypothetical protein